MKTPSLQSNSRVELFDVSAIRQTVHIQRAFENHEAREKKKKKNTSKFIARNIPVLAR